MAIVAIILGVGASQEAVCAGPGLGLGAAAGSGFHRVSYGIQDLPPLVDGGRHVGDVDVGGLEVVSVVGEVREQPVTCLGERAVTGREDGG